MTQFSDLISEHNAYLHDLFGDAVLPDALLQSERANEKSLSQLKALTSIDIPLQLLDFYRQEGGVEPRSLLEKRLIQIPCVSKLLKNPDEKDRYAQLNSLGLIDYIKFAWDNDRWEFDQEIPAKDVDTLNRNYHCFGLYRTSDGFESAYYLYYDKAGNFGSVFYHQDAFDELMEDYLLRMLEKSPASESLDQLLARVFNTIKDE